MVIVFSSLHTLLPRISRSVSAGALLTTGLGGGAAALPRTVTQLSTCFAVAWIATGDFADENDGVVVGSGASDTCWNLSDTTSSA